WRCADDGGRFCAAPAARAVSGVLAEGGVNWVSPVSGRRLVPYGAFNPLIAAITCGMNTVKGGAFLNSGDPKESQHTSHDIFAPKMGSPIYGTAAVSRTPYMGQPPHGICVFLNP